MLKNLIRKWWPGRVDKNLWADRLARFYSENAAYHAMTSGGDKSGHPQVQYLLERIQKDGSYAEIGCGGGLVSSLVAGAGVSVHGFDISPIAVGNAEKRYGCTNAIFQAASADAIPLDDESIDGAWSFEVLEHLWDPVAALREMVRIVKPGGFVFVTCPNHFSLDLYMEKRIAARLADIGCSLLRFVQDKCGRRFFINLEPDILRDDVYPDCDMVSSFLPCQLPRLARELGCRVERLDMFYMCARTTQNGEVDARMISFSEIPVIRWFGDHAFLWMTKSETLSH